MLLSFPNETAGAQSLRLRSGQALAFFARAGSDDVGSTFGSFRYASIPALPFVLVVSVRSKTWATRLKQRKIQTDLLPRGILVFPYRPHAFSYRPHEKFEFALRVVLPQTDTRS